MYIRTCQCCGGNGGGVEDLLVLYWKARGLQKLSSLLSLQRLWPSAPCHGDARAGDNAAAYKTSSLPEPWGEAGVCAVTDSSQTNDLVHQRVLPISPGCIHASATTISKELSVTQIPEIPPLPGARRTRSGSEEVAGMEPQSCPASLHN